MTATRTSPGTRCGTSRRASTRWGGPRSSAFRCRSCPYGRQRSNTFGFTVDRNMYRYAQRASWPLIRQSQAGFVSQFGEIDGLEGLQAPRRLEAAPYLVTKNVSEFTSTGIGRTQDVTVGGDLKYLVASNL